MFSVSLVVQIFNSLEFGYRYFGPKTKHRNNYDFKMKILECIYLFPFWKEAESVKSKSAHFDPMIGRKC